MKKSFSQKQIPTLIGIAILVLSLIGGIALIGKGGELFAPRAAPQTTPKKIKITNVKEDSFTVSFITDDTTAGFLKYGTAANDLRSQSSDDRDQLSGSVGQFTTHYITVRDLLPDTTYYYTLGTGSNSKFDNNGAPFQVKTAKKAGTPPIAKTIYGTIVNADNTPAAGSIVYVDINGVNELSALTKDSGSWAVPLSTARSADGTQFATVNADDMVTITVQGRDDTLSATATMKVQEAQPAKNLTLTVGGANQATTTQTADNSSSGTSASPSNSAAPNASSSDTTTNALPSISPVASASPATSDTTSTSPAPSTVASAASPSAGSGGVDIFSDNSASASAAPIIATQNPDLTTPGSSNSAALSSGTDNIVVQVSTSKTAPPPVVATTQPIIAGAAVPNVTIKVVIHSQAQITTQTTTDSQGNYQVDLSSLNQQLEPGDHTVTITYTDPTTGKTVTTTQKFTVSSTLAMASPQPYGSSNPFPVVSPSPSPSVAPPVSLPATGSTLPRSGSVETTYMVLFSGVFFLIAGAWSFFYSKRALSENRFDDSL